MNPFRMDCCFCNHKSDKTIILISRSGEDFVLCEKCALLIAENIFETANQERDKDVYSYNFRKKGE